MLMRRQELFQEMQQKGVEPDEICFNEIIRIYKDIKEPEGARGVLKQMVDRDLRPTLVNFNSVMDACAKAGKPELAEQVLQELREDLEPDSFTFSALVGAWAKRGDAEKASKALAQMAEMRLRPTQHATRHPNLFMNTFHITYIPGPSSARELLRVLEFDLV